MKSIKIIFRSLLVSLLALLCIYITPIKAKTEIVDIKSSWITVNLISTSIQTSYKSSDYDVIYSFDNHSYIAKIVEKKSNKVISQYSETIENIEDTNNKYTSIIDATINLICGNEEYKANVWIAVNVSVGSYYKQCDQIISYGHDNSCATYTLEDSHTFIEEDLSYPTSSIKVDINGILRPQNTTARIPYNTSITFIFMN